MPPCSAGTHAQKSSTVLNLVTRRRLACHILLLSFLKNHSAHLGGGKGGHQPGWSPPQIPLLVLGEAPHSQPPSLYLFCRGCLPRLSARSSSCC